MADHMAKYRVAIRPMFSIEHVGGTWSHWTVELGELVLYGIQPEPPMLNPPIPVDIQDAADTADAYFRVKGLL